VLYACKPTERSLGVVQAIAGGRIDAPVSGEADAHEVNAYHRPVVLV
jgi:hypothetical protein